MEAVRARLCAHDGVQDVHDLHVWALASSTPALTAHVVIAEGVDADGLRRRLGTALHEEFGIDHVTLQIEADHCGDDCGDGAPAGKAGHGDHDHDHAGTRTGGRTSRAAAVRTRRAITGIHIPEPAGAATMAACLAIPRRNRSDPETRTVAPRPEPVELDNRFTGWVDVELTEQGRSEAAAAGRLMREEGLQFDVAHTSVLKRAIHTLQGHWPSWTGLAAGEQELAPE